MYSICLKNSFSFNKVNDKLKYKHMTGSDNEFHCLHVWHSSENYSLIAQQEHILHV